MRAIEFISETPLPVEQDPEKVWTHTGVWNHTYSEPGHIRADSGNWSNDNDNYDSDYDFETAQEELLAQKRARQLGVGAEAVVIKYDDSHEVVKILGTNANLSQCAHLQYLLACKKYMNENPYLPRIESIKTVNYDGTRLLYTITMEPLGELSLASEDDYDAMLNKMFGFSNVEKEEATTMSMITLGVKNVVFGKQTQNVDPLLVKAGKIIRAVASRVDPKQGIRELADLHSGNMMIRRTSVGPQLVITDPLYSGPDGVRTSASY